MPPNAIYVGRPTKWGNPFRLGDRPFGGTISFIPIYQPTGEKVLAAYRDYVENKCRWIIEEAREGLRGKDLACWCKVYDKNGKRVPCHADILLSIANNIPMEEVCAPLTIQNSRVADVQNAGNGNG